MGERKEMTPASIFPDYYGAVFPDELCEKLAIARIEQPLRSKEQALFKTKWFDYRGLHPVKATYLFAELYKQQFKKAWEKFKDIRTADEVNPVLDENILQSKDAVGYWKARQACDEIGCRYDWYLINAFVRFADRGFCVFPRPNQLYEEGLVLDMTDMWAIECASRLQRPKDPKYLAANFNNQVDQIAFQIWLAKQIKRREQKHLTIRQLMLRDGLLLEATALKAFGDAVVAKAKMGYIASH